MKTQKTRLYIHIENATHFLKWELPYFKKYFELVDEPSSDAVLFVFGPDALATGAMLPARLRTTLIFPGFSYNPYHNLVHRHGMQRVVDEHYDILFANPGPIAEAFKDCPKLRICPFSVDTDRISVRRFRKSIDSLIHISANYPQKDWTRSRDTMQLTGLKYDVFPPRERSLARRIARRIKNELVDNNRVTNAPLLHAGYDSHDTVIRKYSEYDGFVHIAGETPPFVDGKYTATLLEAGLTGSILFWHDTLGLGNDFETIFSLPKDPQSAAEEILIIRRSIDVETHSRLTAEEVRERVNPDKVMRMRFEAIREML